MNNKGYTIVELITVVVGWVIGSGVVYVVYLVIRALQKYIGG